jgi:two-component system CheB/CheR fusion protein
MPLHATQAILVDIVAPVEELPAKLIALLNTVVIENESGDSKNRTSLEKIIILLREETGHDFYYIKNDSNASHRRRKGIHQLDSTLCSFYRRTLMKFSYFSKSY